MQMNNKKQHLDRRLFVKGTIAGFIGAGINFNSFLKGQECDLTQIDILGPYWVQGHPERTMLASLEEPGTRIHITGIITAKDCQTPIKNAIVDVWHANNDGCYTLFQNCENGNPENDSYNLRGIMITDEEGQYAFETVLPGYYTGRPRHFHYKVTTPSGLEHVTQCYFESDEFLDANFIDSHKSLVIPLIESQNKLEGSFNITMDEEADELSINNIHYSYNNDFSINSSYPNPFNNLIKINFEIKLEGFVGIDIFDVEGKWVKSLIGEHKTIGKYTASWNGLNHRGRPVGTGTYIILMKFGNLIKSAKINFLK